MVAYLNAKAKAERKLGLSELGDGIQTMIERQSGLGDEQVRALNRITADYFEILKAKEPQAEAAQQAYTRVCLEMMSRDGKITPTPEFTAARSSFAAVMQQADSVADGAIKRLRAALGEEEFGRLDAFLRQRGQRSETGVPTGIPAPEVAQ